MHTLVSYIAHGLFVLIHKIKGSNKEFCGFMLHVAGIHRQFHNKRVRTGVHLLKPIPYCQSRYRSRRRTYMLLLWWVRTRDVGSISNLGAQHFKGTFSLRKRGHFLKVKRALLCLLPNLGGPCPQSLLLPTSRMRTMEVGHCARGGALRFGGG